MDEYGHVNGVVLNAFGRMPDRGEAVSIGGLNFEVLSTDSRRLRLLRVSGGKLFDK